jgi:hypothetical protein
VHADPEGGRYAQSAGQRLAGQSGLLDVPALRQPGFKVFHLPDFDFNSTCFLLTDCLAEVRRWSGALAGASMHHPYRACALSSAAQPNLPPGNCGP